MGVFFEPYSPNCCCLCGSTNDLTGEHKIKASLLRKIFGRDSMVIGHFDGLSAPRLAQGPKSREFHFSTKLCGECNSDRTQPADHEFVRFHEGVQALHLAGDDPGNIFRLDRYRVGSKPYLDVFRYLAKLMACHIAESNGPRSLTIARFASGYSNFNPIKLFVDADPTYREFASLTGEHSFAAHGGLVVRTDAKTELPTGFHTSLTISQVRYIFWVEFSPLVGLALKMFHRDFFDKCQAAYRAALSNPIPEDQLRRLGL
ncbi:MAG: hypothetical protein EOR68_31755 [Mesorhizobium sp.]|uniref:hypothetical protein n=1 Tax=Mesorhizobium sp. TaxID=1871066 RepID=UPI000FE51A2E|nr:hypothetical protein [Mesorhizobium sp.]RWL79424.1 MAG: hypothetical protein EOR69_25580 [Mesorhizobium sp.]RWL83156.1 MAG: hypothetical protein EOR67_25860 [Mesorhizobium sp.]RWL89256.1 MAG: hypothetical protein EOR68_31755 [Mesorhizobium sp.]RWL93990.1 MAG: hypothetical protein EOR70_26825 [Mesorhizobium sp.]TIP38599.1 MAG: hypothetical protein E5X77_31730 [Mesorhizobium sp.]